MVVEPFAIFFVDECCVFLQIYFHDIPDHVIDKLVKDALSEFCTIIVSYNEFINSAHKNKYPLIIVLLSSLD